MEIEEKIYIRKKLVELFYCGNIDGAIDDLCKCVGFKPFSHGYDVGEEQKSEIEWYINGYYKIKKQEEATAVSQQDGICMYCNDRLIEVKSAKACHRCYQRERNKKKLLIANRFVQ